MIKNILVLLSLCSSVSMVFADDISITEPAGFPQNAIVGKPIEATYRVQNNISSALPININATGTVGNVSCGGHLSPSGSCQFTLTVTPTKTGTYHFSQNIEVCINHSFLCYSYHNSAATIVTSQPTPPKPQPPKSTPWVSQNAGLPNAILASQITDFNGDVYALSLLDNSILYKSEDQGKTWQFVKTNLPPISNEAMPTGLTHSTSELLLGTSAGLYESTDGINWHLEQSIVEPDGKTPAYIRQIINVKDGLFYVTADTGEYESLDDGQTWKKMPLPSTFVFPNANIAYDSSNNLTYIYINHNLYTSSDWQHPIAVPSLPQGASIYFLNGSLYASGQSGFDQYSLFISSDAGKIWKPIYTSEANIGFAPHMFAIGKSLYAATLGGTIQSTDNGTTWNSAAFSGIASSARILSTKENVAGNFLLTTAGIFHSTDKGSTWDNVAKWAFIMKIVATQDKTYALTLMGEIYENNNGVWTSLKAPDLQGETISSLSVHNNTLYVGTWTGSIFSSSDDGSHWASQQLLPNTQGEPPILYKLAQYSVKGVNVFSALTDIGLYTYVNGNWIPPVAAKGLPDVSYISDVASDNTNIYLTGSSIAQSGNLLEHAISEIGNMAEKKIGDGTLTGFVYKSSDLGITWTAANNGLPTDENFIPSGIVSHNKVLYLASNEGVFSSSDQAATWQKLSQPVKDISTGIVTKFSFVNNVFYLATLNGLYQSTDAKTWTLDNENIGSLPAIDFSVTSKNLYLATPLGVYVKSISK